MKNLIINSKLNWITSSIKPIQLCPIIMIFNDGFVSRGYYKDNNWFGYNSNMDIICYEMAPDYYILL